MFPCQLILLLVVSEDASGKSLCYNFISWKGDISPFKSLKDTFHTLNKPNEFVEHMFVNAVKTISTTQCYIRCLS